MKIKDFFKSKWQYIFVFLVPWVLILIHSVLRDSWLFGEGSILYKDAMSVYVPLYSELWDKVHSGGALAFSWTSGLGVEFGVAALRYLVSPFTLLVMLVPRTMIADVVQMIMVLKWSLLSVSMLYYISNTKHNKLTHRKSLMNIVLSMIYFLSNMLISTLHDLSAMDVMIVFPLLLLLVEQMAQQKGYKCFYVLFSLTVLANYQLAIPVAAFLLVWYIIQFADGEPFVIRGVVSFVVSFLMAIMTGMVVIIPNMMAQIDSVLSDNSPIMSVAELLQRFFVCDTLMMSQTEQPMLYCSVAAFSIAMLFVFTKIAPVKKISVCVLTVLLGIGLLSADMNTMWNGTLCTTSTYAFLLVFLIAFMTMETLAQLESVKMWNIAVVGIVGLACVLFGFFQAKILLEFYVYLATILIMVFVVMMLVFYRKKSVQYQNVLIVIAVVCVVELSANALFQLKQYNEFALQDTYYHKSAANLTNHLEVEDGKKVALTQGIYNYGMNLQLPSTSFSNTIHNENIGNLYRSLGMEWGSDGVAYVGGSPLLNTIFNVQYGLGQNEMLFSDCDVVKSSQDGYNLYEMKRHIGLGYMVDQDITNWNLDADSPFEVQNDFVSKATGQESVFEIVTPDMKCMSIAGIDPDSEHEHAHEHEHEHSGEETHSHDAEVEAYYGEYFGNMYYYHFQKIYEDDVVNMSFKSDGVTDYYIYIKSADPSITYVQINGEFVCWDQFASEQKTIHIGVVPKGINISLISNFDIDGMDYSEVWYQVADFKESQYAKVYDLLGSNTLELDTYKDGYIKGDITADTSGIMMTSVPVCKGMSVWVDDEEVEYQCIGNALIGVPLDAGVHEITMEYHIPGLLRGVILSFIGLVIFVLYCLGVAFVINKKK